MKSAIRVLAELPVGSTVAVSGDRYLVVYPGRAWRRVAKDRPARRRRATHVRIVKSDRRR